MNPVNYALNSIRKKAQELFNPVVRQAQQYIKPPKAYTQTFNTPLTQAVRQIPQRPIYNVPNSPTYGQFGNTIKQYGVNQVLKPIVQGSFQYNDPKASRLQKAEGFLKGAQGVFSATPHGAVYNTLYGATAGGLQALRTKQNLQKGTIKGMTNPISLGSEGLGIKNPWLAGGVDLIAGIKGYDPYRSGGMQGLAALEQNLGKAKSIGKTVPTKLLDLGEDFQTAIERVSQGKKSMSKLPILAVPNGKGGYSVLDGNHRLADAMIKGENKIEIITNEKAYRKLAELEDRFINQGKPRYIKGEGGRFAGSTKQAAESSVKLPKQLPKETGRVYSSVDNKIKSVLPNVKSSKEGIKYVNSESPSRYIKFPKGGGLEYEVNPNEIVIRGIGAGGNPLPGQGTGEPTKAVRAIIDLAKQEGKTVRVTGISNHSYWKKFGFEVNNYEGVLKPPPTSSSLPKKLEGLVKPEQISPMGRIKTAEIDNVFKKIPDGTMSSDGYVVKRGDKLFPTPKATPQILKNSMIDLNPDGSINEGFIFNRMGFTEDVGLKDFYNQSKGVQNADLSFKLPVAPSLKVVNGKLKVKMKPVETNFTPFTDKGTLHNEGIQGKLIDDIGKGRQPVAGSTLPPSPSNPSDNSLDPVNKIINALKEAKPVRAEQEALYRAERGKRFGQAAAIAEKGGGEKGFYGQLAKLKGELPKAEFESLRGQLGQGDIDQLFNRVSQHPHLLFGEKLTAQEGLSKLLGVHGAGVPNKSELKVLDEVFGNDFTKALLDKRPKWDKFKSLMGDLLSVPRSLLAGGLDMSYGLRQGILAGWRHPKQWGSAFKEQFKYFMDEKALQDLELQIRSRPTYKLMRENGLALTDLKSHLSNREEQFFSNLAERIPVVGRAVRASGRAYTGFANKFRADIFDDLVKQAQKSGAIDDPNFLRSATEFVNTATGRGSLGGLERSAGQLANVFFSPRLMASRLQTLNPMYYARLHPMVRRRALESVVSTLAGGMSVLALSKMAGADVGTDPTSSDFGKIKIGNTRVDIWGGFQQPMVLLARMLTGRMTSSVTGKEMFLGEGYKPTTRFDIMLRYFESKEAPITSFLTSLMKGTNGVGEEFNLGKEAVSRVVPMFIQNLMELYQDGGLQSLPMSIPAFFGSGVQTYGYKPVGKEEKAKQVELIKKGMTEKQANEQLLKEKKIKIDQEQKKVNLKTKIETGGEINPQTPQEYKAIAGLKDATQAGVVYDLLSKSQFKADLANSYIKEGILTNNVVKQMVEQKLIDQTQATALKGYIKQQKAQTPKPIQVKTQPKPKVQRLRARKPKKFKKLKLPKAKKLKLAKIKKPKQFKKIKVKTDKKPEDKFIKWSSATFN